MGKIIYINESKLNLIKEAYEEEVTYYSFLVAIKEFLSEWGIDISILEDSDVGCLRTLKDQRQLLAHGGQSFSATGRSATWEDIESHKIAINTLFNETKSLLSSFLNQLT